MAQAAGVSVRSPGNTCRCTWWPCALSARNVSLRPGVDLGRYVHARARTHQAKVARGMLALCKTGGVPPPLTGCYTRPTTSLADGGGLGACGRSRLLADARGKTTPRRLPCRTSSPHLRVCPTDGATGNGARAFFSDPVLLFVSSAAVLGIPFLLALCAAVICSS